MNRLLLMAFLAAMSFGLGLLLSCDDDDDDSGDDDNNDDVDDDDDDSGECTPEALCQLSLDCDLGYSSMEDCLQESEQNLQGCADADGFTACLCASLLTDPTCGDYIADSNNCLFEFCV